jgi:translin
MSQSETPPSGGPSTIEALLEPARAAFVAKNQAREAGLALAREVIRASANATRAVHRHDFARADALLAQAAAALRSATSQLAPFPDVLHAGFIHDAAKEYVESRLTRAAVNDEPLPDAATLGVELPAYLNGMGEMLGELRRHILDALRGGDLAHAERLLALMDELYSELSTFDYPEAITGGLRRTVDAARSLLERTRGDLTLAAQQERLAAEIRALRARLDQG